MRIDIVVFDGFDELDAIAPFEVLQNAAAGGADFSVRLVSVGRATGSGRRHMDCGWRSKSPIRMRSGRTW